MSLSVTATTTPNICINANGEEMHPQDIQNKNAAKHIGVPFQEFFSEVSSSLSETFGREVYSLNSEDHTLKFFISNIFLPGTLSCLNADDDLIYPALLLFINKYAMGFRNEIGRKSTLLISPVPPEELVFRILACNVRTGKNRLRDGVVIWPDWAKLVKIAGIIHDGNIFILNEEPECLRDSIALQDVTYSDSKQIPFGLVIIHSHPKSQNDDCKNNPEFMRRLVELRAISTDLQISIIITRNIEDQLATSIPHELEKFFDYQMVLRPEMNRYTLSVSHHENGLVGTIPLVMFPEIGVIED